MTELYLQKTGSTWHRVYFDTSQSGFKLTRENPYFTQSESYTLDVTLPTDILDNRQFFQNMQRIDRTKRTPVMKCRLLVDNIPVLCGSAKVTQVTEQQVKVQLFGGKSEVNFLSTENNEHIDELPLGTRHVITNPSDLAFYSDISTGLPYSHSAIINETSGDIVDELEACHPQLVGTMRLMLSHYGFVMKTGFLDEEPWSKIYIASAMHTLDIAHKLPHWTMKEFFEEFCNFFCITPLIDQEAMTVEFVANSEFLGRDGMTVRLEPVDEYQADISEDEEAASLMGSTLAFTLSSSASHDTDCLDDSVREALPVQEYPSKGEMETGWAAMSPELRRTKIFVSPMRRMISWVYNYQDTEYEKKEYVDQFRPLDRGTEERKELRIVPVAMARGEQYAAQTYHGMPTMENPAGDETPHYWWDDEDNTLRTPTVQEIITGEQDAKKADKEDIMQVMFDDGSYSDVTPTRRRSLGFTDITFRAGWHRAQSLWSLSLNPADADYYLGQLHQNGFSFNMKARHTFRFIADRMPDPRSIFLVRNKRFACEKIEATVIADGFDKLMTGYFYEML